MKAFLAAALLAGLGFSGCAGARMHTQPYVEGRDTVYVGLPVVPASVDSMLAPLGWDSGKFAVELRKELRFQLNRKGVATPDDSAGARSRLAIAMDQYEAKAFSGRASLTTPAGARDIPFGKKRKGQSENRDPTIDDIRFIAANLAEETRTDPRHRKKQDEPFTGLLMIF